MGMGKGGGIDPRATGVLRDSGGPGSLLPSYAPRVPPYTYLYTRIPSVTLGEITKISKKSLVCIDSIVQYLYNIHIFCVIEKCH